MEKDDFEILIEARDISENSDILDIEINTPISEEDLRLEYLEKLVLPPKKD